MKLVGQYISIFFLWLAALFILIHPVLPHSQHFSVGDIHGLCEHAGNSEYISATETVNPEFNEGICHTHNSSKHKEGCVECSFNADYFTNFSVYQFFAFTSDNSNLLPDVIQQTLRNQYFNFQFPHSVTYCLSFPSRAPPCRA